MSEHPYQAAGDNGLACSGPYGVSAAGDAGTAKTGDYGVSAAGVNGDANSGDYGVSASLGSASVGNHGVCVVRGNGVRAMGGIGSILVLCEESEDDSRISAWKAVVVDGETVKPDTWYILRDGALVEA